MIQTDLRTMLSNRAQQFALFVRELKLISQQIVTAIDAGPVRAAWLVEKQNSLAQVKTNFNNWPYGDLKSAAVRAEVARQWPESYADAAAVMSELSGLNTMFTSMTNALEAAINIARGRGQLVDSNSVTNLVSYQTLTGADVSALRAASAAVVAGIAGEL